MASFTYKCSHYDEDSLERLRNKVVQEVIRTHNYPPSESFIEVDDRLQFKSPDEKAEFIKMQADYIRQNGFDWFKNTIRGWYFPTLNAVGVTTWNGEKLDEPNPSEISPETLNELKTSYPGADIFSFIGGPHFLSKTDSPALKLFMNYLFKNANTWHKRLYKESASSWWAVPGSGLAGAALATLINLGIPDSIIQEKSKEGLTPHQIVQEYNAEEFDLKKIEESPDIRDNISQPDKKILPRGIRNNNPGNIESNEKWQGMSDDQSDGRFITFESPEYGIRAMARILRNYQRRYNLNSVQQIISRWAPPSENNTKSYIDHVAKQLGVSPDEAINLSNGKTLEHLIKAMIRHENGNGSWYNDITIQKGINMERTGFINTRQSSIQNQAKLQDEKLLFQLISVFGNDWNKIVKELVRFGIDSNTIRQLNQRFIQCLAGNKYWNYKY